jgi:hypothetical protein
MDVRSARKSRAVIDVLGGTSYGELPGLEPPFVQGLKEAGFIVDKDIGIEWRWAERHYDRLPSLVSERIAWAQRIGDCRFDAPAAFAARRQPKLPGAASYSTHSLRRTKPTLIYLRTGNLRAVQLLLGHTKLDYVQRRTITRRAVTRLIINANG